MEGTMITAGVVLVATLVTFSLGVVCGEWMLLDRIKTLLDNGFYASTGAVEDNERIVTQLRKLYS